MITKSIEKLLVDLEKTELEEISFTEVTNNKGRLVDKSDILHSRLKAIDGSVPTHVYSQLLAIYLYKNELCYAKYLWKRIPIHLKNSCSEIQNIWTVAQKMWQRDWPAVHTSLNVEWNTTVVEIMTALKDRIRERATMLVCDAYSSLDITTLSKMTGLSSEECRQMAIDNDWALTGTIVKPRKMRKQCYTTQETITEEQLYKLTQFVSFLEN